ncbi:HTH domain-containing protein [Rahnella sp. ChDrAdgB13]|uniref:HTH domain-containing protein n=1 Tax=Rahnella sp. ChDrAdgB13 TaxID=1850581 RepID=UPI001AD895E6|nr:HTH domain-containing protein [Rahnella sp. ChDrAdgB13]
MITTQTIPELLIATRGNITELARRLDVNRSTVMKYARDNNATGHIIVNGCLMVKTAKKQRSRHG